MSTAEGVATDDTGFFRVVKVVVVEVREIGLAFLILGATLAARASPGTEGASLSVEGVESLEGS